MGRIRVYVAGPYSKTCCRISTSGNVRNAVLAGDELWARGFVPYIPHLTHLWDLISPKSYEEWLELDNCFLPCCRAVLRLPGESSGADKEVELAENLGIPVFSTIELLVDWFRI